MEAWVEVHLDDRLGQMRASHGDTPAAEELPPVGFVCPDLVGTLAREYYLLHSSRLEGPVAGAMWKARMPRPLFVRVLLPMMRAATAIPQAPRHPADTVWRALRQQHGKGGDPCPGSSCLIFPPRRAVIGYKYILSFVFEGIVRFYGNRDERCLVRVQLCMVGHQAVLGRGRMVLLQDDVQFAFA